MSNIHNQPNESEDTLTNRQGHVVTNNQSVRTVGNRGPVTIENYDFLEKISHFDREKEYLSGLFMPVVLVPMDISNPMEP